MHTSQNEAISKNIENANTIDFIRKDTDFSELLPEVQQNNKITTTNKNHLTKLHYNSSWENNNEEKGIDLTQEMSEMAINQINHDFNVRAIRRMYDGIRAAIKGHSK